MVFTALAAVFLFSVSSYARSGCCSWHGGVSGCDTNTGRQVCNDGTYSPTCTCAYIPPQKAVQPTVSEYSTSGHWQFTHTNAGVNVTFDWDDTSPTEYSIGISSYAGSDPGPLSDTSTTNWVFHNVSNGKKYINLKKKVNGIWSNITYWEINVPEWVKPTPNPTRKPYPSPSVTGVSQGATSDSHNEPTDSNFVSFGLLSALLAGGYFLGKRMTNRDQS